MDFRLLGPLEVRANGRALPLGGPKQRAVLALLLLSANRVVPRERLIAEVWPEALGRDAEHALTVQISRLRKVLNAADGEPRVITHPPGYLLRVEENELDLHAYERLVSDGRAALKADDPESAAALLRRAESLWRGRAVADLELDLDHLEESHLTALEDRIEAELLIGHHRPLVAELETLVAEHPLRERLRAQLMRALYASSRQAEALAVYTDTRRLLVDELGIEPSESLRELERRILAQDSALLPPGTPPDPPFHDRSPDHGRPRATPAVRGKALLMVAPVVLAALLVTMLVGFDARRPAAPDPAGAGSVILLDGNSGRQIGAVGTGPGAGRMRFAHGVLWKLEDPGELLQIDPQTMRLKRSTPIGFAGDLAVAPNGVWVSGDTNTLVRVDPTYGTVAQRIRLPERGLKRHRVGGGVAVGAGSVWVSQGQSRVLRINAATERIEHVFQVPDASVLKFGGGALWAASSDLGTLTKIDPGRNVIVASARIGPWICCVAVGGGYVWAANHSGIWKISSEGDLLGVTELPSEAGEISFGDGALWATSAGTIVRIDADTGATVRRHVAESLNGIAAAGGLVGVSAYVPERPEPSATLRGAILHGGRTAVWFSVTDPALAAVPGERSWWTEQQLQDATCAGLLRYHRARAPIRWRLAPEAASALPTVSQDGRTYTFRIKHGLRFSPPSNQPVTAATFKYSIERALSPVLGAGPPALRLAADIRGVRAYRAGKARHIQGVRAHGDTLAITLAHRAPDIADRIAAPQFCPVPLGTPIAAAGDHDEPIPAAGPYYLSANAGGELAVIRRNPNYNGSRPHRVDAMIFRGRVPLAKTIARVAAGADDYAAEDGPALEADGLIARRFGRGSETGRRFQRTPLLGTDVLAFNMQRGLLRDPRVRRAVNYAIDRPAIAAALGDSATDRYLPADMPGSRAGHVYPLHRSNPHRARMLMGDRATRLVVAVCSEPRCARVGRLVAADLQRVGIRVRLRNYRGDIASRTHRAATDIVLARILAPYPDPVAFMRNALGVAAKGLGVEKLAHLNRPRRLSAAGRLELALLRHRPPAAAIGTPTVPEFFSARVGCKKPSSLSFGVELGSLCLRRP